MSLEGFHILIIVLSVTTQSCTSATLVDSAGRKIKDPFCSTTQFYCPYDSTHRCRPRSARCLLESERTKQSCLNPRSHQEEGCHGDLKTGVFDIMDGWTRLSSSVSSTTAFRSHHRLKHEFVTYRGFTYEYSSRGVDIRDISDPNYRYKIQKVLSFTKVGTSKCRMSDLYSYTSQWKGRDYNIFRHNGQHFADGLIRLLKSDCRSTGSLRSMYQAVIDTSDQGMHSDSDSSEPHASLNYMGSRVSVDQDNERFQDNDSNQAGVMTENTNPNEDSVTSKYTVGFAVFGIAIAVLAVTMAIVAAMVIFKKKRKAEERKALLGDENKT